MARPLILRLALALLAWTGGAGILLACSVPVFRYALERWAPDDYVAVVLHQGPLHPAESAALRELERGSRKGGASLNLAVRPLDLAAADDPAARHWRQALPAGAALPSLVLLYPPALRQSAPAWQGAFTSATVAQVLDSPRRHEIAGRLLRGDTAVWVLLDSGDDTLDTAAARTLDDRLRHLAATLRLPELNPADLREDAAAGSTAQLRVAFSTLRLSRQDTTEAVLVQLLLHTEPDLAASRAPIAFPVFGRGRVLPALVGKGINAENIDEAARFLTGACSCVVKEENPGRDLLLAVDWVHLVNPLLRADNEPPPLPGLAEFAPAGQTPAAKPAATVAAAVRTAPSTPASSTPSPDPGGRVTRSLLPGLLTVGGAVTGLLLGATWWLLRRRP